MPLMRASNSHLWFAKQPQFEADSGNNSENVVRSTSIMHQISRRASMYRGARRCAAFTTRQHSIRNFFGLGRQTNGPTTITTNIDSKTFSTQASEQTQISNTYMKIKKLDTD